MIFSIYDEITRENPIPNGFNMSIKEFERHKFKKPGKSNTRFKIDDSVLTLDREQIIPLSIVSFKKNPDFFKKTGMVVYPIYFNQGFNDYPELSERGMNSWLSYMDEETLFLIKKFKITMVLVFAIERITIDDITRLQKNLEEYDRNLLDFVEVWTPYSPPFNSENLINYYKEKNYNEQTVRDRFERCKKLIKDIPYWEIETVKIYESSGLKLEKTKSYINLCRRYTHDRLLTHSFIVANNLLDLGFNSIPDRDTIDNRSLHLRLRESANRYTLFHEEAMKTFEYWKSNPQGIVLDEQPISDVERTIYSGSNYHGFKNKPDLEKYYAQSYMSLINEGDIHFGSFMITEKTFRAMLYKHFFIIIGPQFVLEALKEKGYKTFDSLWPEDYDKIEDDQKRWKAALELFKEIATSNKIHKVYSRALPIIEHNYNHMFFRIEQHKNKYRT